MAVTLGKDVTVTGINNARSITVTSSAGEIDCTAFGDSQRKYRKQLVEQTVEVECVDSPGVTLGGTFTLGGTDTGDVTFIVTSIAQNEPIDDIVTFTVSASRTTQSS